MDKKTRKLMTMHKALYPKDDIDFIYLRKNEEEYSPTLKIVWMHQYVDSKTTLQRAEKDHLQRPILTLTT